MNSTVSKTIGGERVSAQPIYKGDSTPAYWTATVNERTLPLTFDSATEVFRFVESRNPD